MIECVEMKVFLSVMRIVKYPGEGILADADM